MKQQRFVAPARCEVIPDALEFRGVVGDRGGLSEGAQVVFHCAFQIRVAVVGGQGLCKHSELGEFRGRDSSIDFGLFVSLKESEPPVCWGTPEVRSGEANLPGFRGEVVFFEHELVSARREEPGERGFCTGPDVGVLCLHPRGSVEIGMSERG